MIFFKICCFTSKEAAAKTGNKVDDLLVAQLERLFES